MATAIPTVRTSEITSVITATSGRKVEGRRIDIGADRYMAELGADTAAMQARAQALQGQGATVSWLADVTDGPRLLGLLAFGDTLKPSAAQAVQQLQRQGVRIAGLFMRNWDDDSGDCRAEDDRRDAVAVCGRLALDLVLRPDDIFSLAAG